MPRGYSCAPGGAVVTTSVEVRAYDVEFIDVGRNKHRWTERLTQQPTEPILANLVRKRGALMSQDIECDAGLVIVGGMREVGRYEIREVAP